MKGHQSKASDRVGSVHRRILELDHASTVCEHARMGQPSRASPRPRVKDNSSPVGMNEAQLLRKACQGDGPAVRALYERYSPRVYAVVRRIAADDDLAQDYAQEAWIRAIRALPTFRGEARFSTWLHRIAVNSALQAVRTAETRHMREAPMPESMAVALPHSSPILVDERAPTSWRSFAMPCGTSWAPTRSHATRLSPRHAPRLKFQTLTSTST